jgi:hypothetical protein
LLGALFKGQLQAAKKTLDSQPVQKQLQAQASARAAAVAKEAETTVELAKAERAQRAAAVGATQARKRVMEATVMASRWQAHYRTLAQGEYLATQAEPALFWKPAKPNAGTLKALLLRRKQSCGAMEVQQPLWDAFVAQEKREVAAMLAVHGRRTEGLPAEPARRPVRVIKMPPPAAAGADPAALADCSPAVPIASSDKGATAVNSPSLTEQAQDADEATGSEDGEVAESESLVAAAMVAPTVAAVTASISHTPHGTASISHTPHGAPAHGAPAVAMQEESAPGQASELCGVHSQGHRQEGGSTSNASAAAGASPVARGDDSAQQAVVAAFLDDDEDD